MCKGVEVQIIRIYLVCYLISSIPRFPDAYYIYHIASDRKLTHGNNVLVIDVDIVVLLPSSSRLPFPFHHIHLQHLAICGHSQSEPKGMSKQSKEKKRAELNFFYDIASHIVVAGNIHISFAWLDIECVCVCVRVLRCLFGKQAYQIVTDGGCVYSQNMRAQSY